MTPRKIAYPLVAMIVCALVVLAVTQIGGNGHHSSVAGHNRVVQSDGSPGAGGTACAPAQLRRISSVDDAAIGELDMNQWGETVQLRNTGPGCTFSPPDTVNVSTKAGKIRTVRLLNTHQHAHRLTNGAIATIVITNSWPTKPRNPVVGTPSCTDAVKNVVSVGIPQGGGYIAIPLSWSWGRVCQHPSEIALYVTRVRHGAKAKRA